MVLPAPIITSKSLMNTNINTVKITEIITHSNIACNPALFACLKFLAPMNLAINEFAPAPIPFPKIQPVLYVYLSPFVYMVTKVRLPATFPFKCYLQMPEGKYQNMDERNTNIWAGFSFLSFFF